jgi:hypothetical protein
MSIETWRDGTTGADMTLRLVDKLSARAIRNGLMLRQPGTTSFG